MNLIQIGILSLCALPVCVFAALGEDEASVSSDQARLGAATRKQGRHTGYTTQEMTTPAGTLVKEYVSPAGKVFAVSWKGPLKPDLQQLFGTYFETYTNGTATKGGRGAAATDTPTLVVRSGGRVRAFSGYAYLPGLLPEGFALEGLQ